MGRGVLLRGAAAATWWFAGTAGLSYGLGLLLSLRGPLWVFLPLSALVLSMPCVVLLPRGADTLARLMGCSPMPRRIFAPVHRLLEELSLRLGVSKPELYQAGGGTINATSLGTARRGAVLLSSGAVNALDDRDMSVLLACELEEMSSGRSWLVSLLVKLFPSPLWSSLVFGTGWMESDRSMVRRRSVFVALSMDNMAFFGGLLLGESAGILSTALFYIGLPGFLLMAFLICNYLLSLPLLLFKTPLGERGLPAAASVPGWEGDPVGELRLKAMEAQLTTRKAAFERLLSAGALNLRAATFLGDIHPRL